MSATAGDPLLAPLPATPAEGGAAREDRVFGSAPATPGAAPAKTPRTVDRDPFSRGSSGMIEGGRDPRQSPLLMALPESYVITGVIVSPGVKAAMIRTDFRENYVVKIGDRLGNQGGIITDIDMDGIVLKQGNGRLRLYLQSQYGQQPAPPGR